MVPNIVNPKFAAFHLKNGCTWQIQNAFPHLSSARGVFPYKALTLAPQELKKVAAEVDSFKMFKIYLQEHLMTDVGWRRSFSEEPVAGWGARAPNLGTQHPGYWRHISEIIVY